MKTTKQFAVLHIEKGQSTDSGMSAHIERTITPSNVDPSRTHLNRQLIAYPDHIENRSQAIQHRIENAGIKRKVSKNQIRVLRVMLSGTHEQMKALEHNGQLEQWIDENMRWLKDTFDEKNIVSAHLHMDEKTPHIHVSVVPIVTGERRKNDQSKKKKTKDRVRLCADDIMTRTNLKNLQDSYAETMKPFGLERGVEGSEAKHISTQEYYRNIHLELERLREEQLISAEQLKDIKCQVAKAKSEKQVEELKNSLSKFGTNVTERLSSLFDSSGRKQRDEKIAELEKQLAKKDKAFSEIRVLYNNEIAEIQTEQTKILKAHNDWRKKVEDFIPLLWERLRIAEICKKLFRIDSTAIKKILSFTALRISGKVRNPDNGHAYEITNLKVQMARTTDNPEKLELRLDDVEHTKWIKQKAEERNPKITLQQQEQLAKLGVKIKM